jgi:hypothetical protein
VSKLGIVRGRISAGHQERMAQHHKFEVCPRSRQGLFKPGRFVWIDGSQDPRIDRDQREAGSMKLKERSSLQAIPDTVVLAQTIGFVGDLMEPLISCNSFGFKIRQQACFHREYGGVAF